ncbi:MAG: ribosomal-processing cysteine protease Prp [Clostridia bacterium]|nr:ribosomal-processing cysteine protease Prp [Clostridia bacterium]
MTRVAFYSSGEQLIGFEIQGHSSASATDTEGKIVCAAISSAAYMTANTLTDVIGAAAEIQVDEAKMVCRLTSKIQAAQPILKGFWLHISQLAQDYSNRITLISEV